MPQDVYRFGDFELDPLEHVLRRRGERVALRPQAFRALVLLASRAGSLVTRDELRLTVWPGELVVDFEHGLNACIRQIRAALHDDAERPAFVETVPRVGYRFVAQVETIPRGDPPQPTTMPPPGGTARALPTARLRTAATVAAIVVAAAAITMLLGRYMWEAAARSSEHAHDERYVRARMLLDGWTAAGARTALGLFEQIAASNPAHAAAHAGIAHAYLLRPYGIIGVDSAVALPRARSAIERALALDAREPEAHVALAYLRLRFGDWAGAGAALHRARELAPGNARIRTQIAEWLALRRRFEEALVEASAAEALDPLSARARHESASIYRYARRFDEAIAHARRALELDPNFGPAHYTLGHSHLAQGDYEAAIAAFRRSGGPSGNLGHALAIAGRTAEAEDVLRMLERRYADLHVGEGEIAQVLIGLGQQEAALEWLTRAAAQGNGFTLNTAAIWDPLRGDPRFAELLTQAGFSNAPPAMSEPVNKSASPVSSTSYPNAASTISRCFGNLSLCAPGPH